MLLLDVDRGSRVPLQRQIVERIREKIEARALAAGERLPSTRRLASALGVHRSTVALAYQQLWSLGFIDLRPGSRPRVRQRTAVVAPSHRTGKGAIAWKTIAAPGSEEVVRLARSYPRSARSAGDPTVIDFSTIDMDRRLFPLDRFRSCLNRTLARNGRELLGYGDPAGYRPLREYVAQRLGRHGVSVTAEEILLTNGSQQAIDLLFRLVAAPGKAVAFESPTYNLMLPLLRLYGLKPIEIPLRLDGMDLDALEREVGRQRPTLIYTMPTLQNPTGVCTTQAHRERLLALCEAERIPLVEDGFEEEMQYSGRIVLPLKSMDRQRLVVYCGTFSKVLFPGVRIGWVAAARECIERLEAIRRFEEVAPGMILQAALHEFCRDGSYDRHVSKMHRVFRKRMQTAIRVLRERLEPEWARWAEPSGGYLLWLELSPALARTRALPDLLSAHGVRAAPGRHFFCSPRSKRYLRLSISTLSEEEIVEGVTRLCGALREAFSRRAAQTRRQTGPGGKERT
jgi:DNA-binding transcriptional MocR family regulator